MIDGRERHERWARAALVDEVSAVASTGEGGRHKQLNVSAFKLGQIPLLTEDEITRALLDAAKSCRLLERETEGAVRAITNTIRSGIKAGRREPRGPKESAGAPASAKRPSAATVESSPPAPPLRPPQAELLKLLTVHSRPLEQDADVVAMLASRGIDTHIASDRELGVALRRDLAAADHPAWAFFNGRPWAEAGYRLVLPLYDATGKITSVQAKNLDPAIEPKILSPYGFAAGGLVFADAGGILMLRTRELAGLLWIVEGAPDFLTLATYYGDAADPAPSVLGVLAGSWTDAIAERVPDGGEVIVAVHHDDTGESYAGKITGSLAGRVTLMRWVPEGRAAA